MMRFKRSQTGPAFLFGLLLPVLWLEAAELARYDFSGGSPSAVVMEQGVFGADAQWVGLSGGFIVSRLGGNTSSPLVVPLGGSGSASNGVDYVALPSSVTIPADETSVGISVVPLTDSLAEGEEFVWVELVDDEAYDLGVLQAAHLTLEDRPYDAWRHEQFSFAELADEQVSGDAADPDQDGRPNAVEAFYGTDPRVADELRNQPAFHEQGGKDYFSLEFSKETFRVRDLTPVDAAGRRFIRVRVLKEESF